MIVWSGAISHPLMILIKFFTHIAICLSWADFALMRSNDFVLTGCNQEFCTHIPWLFNHRIRFKVCLGIITSDIQQRDLNYEVESQNIGISNIISATAPFWASPCADRNCIASATKKRKPWEKMETVEKCSEALGLTGTRLATRRHCKVKWRQLDGQESTQVRRWISVFLLFRPIVHIVWPTRGKALTNICLVLGRNILFMH